MNMKKALTLMVLALFVISAVPFALAQDDDANDSDNADDTRATTRDNDTEEDDDEQEDEEDDKREESRDAERKLVREQKDLREAAEDFKEAKGVLAERRADLNDAKARLARCRDSESEACKALRSEVREDAREFLLRSADAILAALDRAVSRITNSTQLTDAEKAEALTDLNVKIDEITTAKVIIENLDGNSTEAQIREAAKTIDAAWKRSKVALKRHEGRQFVARLHGLLVKMDKLAERLEKELAKLEEKGLDTSSATEKKADFDAKLAAAQVHYDLAKAAFNSETERDVQKAHEELRAMHDNLKEAHRILQEIVKSIKDLNKGRLEVDDDEDDEQDDEDEEDEEEDEGKEETDVEVRGDVTLSAEAQSTLDQLVASFANTTSTVELELEVKKLDGNITVEAEVKKGNLTADQQNLWTTLQNQARALVEAAEGEDIELEIEIEHELEAQPSAAEDDEDKTGANDADDDEDEDDTEEDDSDNDEDEEDDDNAASNSTSNTTGGN